MMTDLSILKRYIRMADDGWQQGWHERNGGNLTYRRTRSHRCAPSLMTIRASG